MRKISTHEELRALYGEPVPNVCKKIHDRLNDQARDFIARSPLVFVGSRTAAGGVEVSPKGDAPGFVRVVDDRTLQIPDRPGNRLLMGLEDVLVHPEVGLLFAIPNTIETLRCRGTAELFHDPGLQHEMAAHGKDALLIMQVTVEECFFHCAKAMIRGEVWKSEHWGAPFRVNWGLELEGTADPAVQARWDEAAAAAYRNDL